MSNVLTHDERHQVLTLGRLGWSLRQIQRETGIHRDTAGAYLRAAGIPVRMRGGRPGVWPPKPATTSEVSTDFRAKPATTAGVSTDPIAAAEPSRAPSTSACEPYRELIEPAVAAGQTAMAIWQDLVDAHQFPARYASVRRFVAALRGVTAPEGRVVMATPPGQEGQVDYGDGPMVRSPNTGKYRRTRLFVMTLAYSRKAVRLLIWNPERGDASSQARRFQSVPFSGSPPATGMVG